MSTYSNIPCPTDYCPGCTRLCLRCACPPPWYEDHEADAAYERGYAHGLADGPENRPSEAWLRSELNPRREPLATDYLSGYDDGAAGLENRVVAVYAAEDELRRQQAIAAPKAPNGDDGLPF